MTAIVLAESDKYHGWTETEDAMRFRQWILLFGAVSAALAGCGGSSSANPTPALPISVAFSTAAPAGLEVNATATLAVTLANDSTGAGIKWSVTCGSTGAGACGSFSTSGPGTSTVYAAPSALPSGNNSSVSVTATSVADSTKSVSTSIAINAPNIRVMFSSGAFPPNAVTVGAQVRMAAVVTGDPSNNGVSWSATCGVNKVPCGFFNPSITPSGVSTVFAEASVSFVGSNVTVQASSVTNPGDSVSIPIFVSGEPLSLADGAYVFQLSGTNANHFYSVSGVFTVSKGAITGGEQDFIDPAIGAKSDAITGGSILAVGDGNLWITIKTADASVGVNGVETLDVTLNSSSRGTLIEFDSSSTASGTLDLQTSTAAPSGGYAFFAYGRDSAKKATSIGGVLNVDGAGTISGNGSVFDINDTNLAGPLAAQAFVASTVTAPDSQGRVEFKLIPSVASGVAAIDLVGYTVNAKLVRLVETTDTYGGSTGGMALGQTGTFTSGSISSNNFVFGAAGEDANGALQTAGLMVAGPNTGTAGAVTGNVTGTFSWNDHSGVAIQMPLPLAAGTYTLDTAGVGAGTGRVTLAGLTDSTTNPTFTYDLELYLTGDGRGLLILMDQDEVIAGEGFQQTGGPFNFNSFSGTYALNVRHVVPNGSIETRENGAGPLTADGAGNLAGFLDLNQAGGPNAFNLALNGTFTGSATGVFIGTIAGLDTSPSPPVHNFAYYLVSPSQAVLIETDNAQLTLGFLQLQQ
jgi:hypothetical protein